MKVNISYTVDLEEVLDEMAELYYKSVDKLERHVQIYDSFLENGFSETQVEQIINALEHKLDCYTDHQTKIADVLNILQGYKNIKNGDIPEEQANDSVNRGD
mgnify:CR=1 FL=1|tara:strand:- start:178 stop:483 length:306 start_codon:yes stop_codon:yes gene_type:complete